MLWSDVVLAMGAGINILAPYQIDAVKWCGLGYGGWAKHIGTISNRWCEVMWSWLLGNNINLILIFLLSTNQYFERWRTFIWYIFYIKLIGFKGTVLVVIKLSFFLIVIKNCYGIANNIWKFQVSKMKIVPVAGIWSSCVISIIMTQC